MRRWWDKLADHVTNFLHQIWRIFGSLPQSRVENSLRPAFGPILPNLSQLRLLPKILSAQEKRAALSLIILVAISGLAFGWRLYEKKTSLVAQAGGEYSEGVIGNPHTANPLLATSDADIDLAFLTHRALFQINEQGQIIKDLADNWELNEDKKTYIIKLHSGLLWSDGQQLTASDIVFTFNSIKQAKLKSPLAASFRDITVAQVDELTVSFTLKEPYAPFLYALTVGLVPEHIWQRIPYENWLQAETNLKPIGSGPWRFSSLTRDGQGNVRNYILEPNPFYADSSAYFKKISLRFYPDTISALEALRQGSIDGLGDLSAQARASLNPRRFIIHNITLPQYTAIFYNPNANNLLKDAAIRQGLSYAINRPALIQEALSGQAQPATGPFIFGEVKARTSAQAISYDPTKTIQLFEAAGFKRNAADGLLLKDNSPLEITLTLADNDEQLLVANEIKKQWEEVGVKVNLQPVSTLFLQSEVINPRNYQALLISEVVGLDPDPYPFWHSSQVASPGLNLAQFQNHDADELLVEARQTFNEEERIAKYVSFQNILRQQSPATFLYSLNYSYAQSYSIKGFSRSVMGQPAERFLDANRWYRKVSRSWND